MAQIFGGDGEVRLIVTQLSQFAACDEAAATNLGKKGVGRWMAWSSNNFQLRRDQPHRYRRRAVAENHRRSGDAGSATRHVDDGGLHVAGIRSAIRRVDSVGIQKELHEADDLHRGRRWPGATVKYRNRDQRIADQHVFSYRTGNRVVVTSEKLERRARSGRGREVDLIGIAGPVRRVGQTIDCARRFCISICVVGRVDSRRAVAWDGGLDATSNALLICGGQHGGTAWKRLGRSRE
jgi:hypothetical protein